MCFKHRCIQDLAWVIRSAPILSGEIKGVYWLTQKQCEAEYQACLPQLLELDDNPVVLEQQLAVIKPYIIGKRFECLVNFWLNISPNFEVLIHNYVLQGEQQTLGEIDFIIRELATNKIIHLEVAVKFYLGRDNLSQMNSWYGTNLKDRLDIKYQRLVEHQTQLSIKFPDLMPYMVDESWCLFKGRMFYPYQQKDAKGAFEKDCPTGFWVYDNNAPQGADYAVVKKQDWLARIVSSNSINTLPTALKSSECYARINNKEVERLFVLPMNFWEALDISP